MKPQRWTALPPDWLDRAIQSGCTRQLSREQWPPFMTAESFTGAIVYLYDGPTVEPSAHTTTPVIGRMDVERFDNKDAQPLNYVRHYLVCHPDGRVLLSPPEERRGYRALA